LQHASRTELGLLQAPWLGMKGLLSGMLAQILNTMFVHYFLHTLSRNICLNSLLAFFSTSSPASLFLAIEVHQVIGTTCYNNLLVWHTRCFSAGEDSSTILVKKVFS
jgi:hypothetical protein